jgi:hypothetical protein
MKRAEEIQSMIDKGSLPTPYVPTGTLSRMANNLATPHTDVQE